MLPPLHERHLAGSLLLNVQSGILDIVLKEPLIFKCQVFPCEGKLCWVVYSCTQSTFIL